MNLPGFRGQASALKIKQLDQGSFAQSAANERSVLETLTSLVTTPAGLGEGPGPASVSHVLPGALPGYCTFAAGGSSAQPWVNLFPHPPPSPGLGLHPGEPLLQV